MSETKARRQRRTKASIVSSIEQAAENEIAQSGFISSRVTSIIKKAQIEPQVFYNRYADISEFYDSFVKKYDSWLSEILKGIDEPVESAEGMRKFFTQTFLSLNEDPVVLELIRWELFENNPTTARSSALREHSMQPVTQEYVQEFLDSDIDIIAILGLVGGGLYYLSLHKKLSPFYGLDPDSEEGRSRIVAAIDRVLGFCHAAKQRTDRDEQIRLRLRQAGVSDDVIDKALADD